MIQAVVVKNDNNELLEMKLSEPNYAGLQIVNISGLEPVTASINTTDFVTMDGSLFNSSRVSYRNIVIEISFVGDDAERSRHECYKYFTPKHSLEIMFITSERSCYTYGIVESNDIDIFSELETSSISIICPSPWFIESTDRGYKDIEFDNVQPLFEFPFPKLNETPVDTIYIDDNNDAHIMDNNNDPLVSEYGNQTSSSPIIFGMIGTNKNITKDVYYDGDVDTGVEFYINCNGHVGDISLMNVTTRQEFVIKNEYLIKFLPDLAPKDGTQEFIKSGDAFYVSTIDGQKKVILIRDGESYNALNCISFDSSWFGIIHGNNRINVTASKGHQYLNVHMKYQTLYVGV